ncbi:MAG: sarcosine oxidase subunit gamma [Woeseiaceae bacterium]
MAENPGWLRVLAPAARFIFQGKSEARAAAGHSFGVPLPEEPCRAHSVDGRSALWLGPDEQLLLAPAADMPTIAANIAAALEGTAHSLVDVSDRQIAMAVNGSRATAILSTGCPLDLDPAEFPVGMCTRTVLGKAEVVLWRRSAEEYHLEVPRSYQGYLAGFLDEAGQTEALD